MNLSKRPIIWNFLKEFVIFWDTYYIYKDTIHSLILNVNQKQKKYVAVYFTLKYLFIEPNFSFLKFL